jgi:hypothetical protein
VTAPIEPRPGGQGFDDHGEWDALAVGWALSALEPGDEDRFAAHLPTCERCPGTIRESLRTVADLAYALPEDAPPAALKQRIMAAAAAEPRSAPALGGDVTVVDAPSWPLGQDAPGGSAEDWFARSEESRRGSDHAGPTGRLRPPEPPTGEEPAAAGAQPPRAEPEPSRIARGRGRHAAPDGDEPGGPDGHVVPFAARRRRWASVLASAAAVVIIAALTAWNLQLRSDRADLRRIVAQREAAISELTADGPAQVAAVQAVTPDLKPLPTRRATIVVKDGRAEVITETLAPRTGTETYWLWTLDCVGTVGNLKPITGFQVPQAGFSIRNVGSEPGLSTTQCFALSAETVSGTPTKPGVVVAVGQLK